MKKEDIVAADFSDSAELLKAIGHPARLKIAIGLASNACCVKDIWQCMDLPQPVVSQHLMILKSKGIVKSTREGKRRLYTLSDPLVKKIVNEIVKKIK